MLCNSKISNRPDKVLQSALFKLAGALVLLTLSLIWFFLWPEHHLYSTILTSLVTIYCLVTAIKTLNAGEAAISYGGFAAEIIRNDFKIRRIENPRDEVILQNNSAKELFGNDSVLSFLDRYLAEGNDNKAAFYRLQTAYKNLGCEKVTLALALNSESRRVFKDYEHFEVSLRPIYLKKPEIFDGAFSVKRIKKETYFYWTLHNITAKQNMDYVFKEECSSLHDFLDDLPVGLYTIDKDSRIKYANRNLAAFLGRDEQSLNGELLLDFITPDSSVPLKKDFWFGPVHFVDANQKAVETYVFQSSYREQEKIMMRGVVVHQLPTPDELREKIDKSLDEVNWLFKNSPIGIVFIDENGAVINSNSRAAALLGVDETAETGLFGCLDVHNAELLKEALHKSLRTGASANLELKTAEHSLSLYISQLRQMHQQRQNGGNKFIIYVIDNTRQKMLETQFAQAQKMQAVGQFAGGIAHDFNNLLTAIIGFADLLLQRHGVGDPSFADLIQIKQNANRATNLVRQLLAFSRQQPLMPKLIDIADNFADLSQMLKRILGEKIKLEIQHGTDLGYVKVDPTQFSQVIINLAVNAKDAMEGKGQLVISTSTCHLSEKYVFGDDVVEPGDFVVINVTDTGCGIPKENLSRIFDPFFSTKENIVGSGTGLGLAMVYGIVRQTEGFIKVQSVVGEGTTFSIYLPRFETAPEEAEMQVNPVVTGKEGQTILQVKETLSAPASVNQKIIMGLNIFNAIDRSHSAVMKGDKPARILFVEDEDAVRSVAVRALKKKGYDVADSSSAENALEILEQDKDFDLLLTDMVLPGLSGAQLTNKVKEICPDIEVILASGYSEDIARQEVDNTHEFYFITKPYSLGDLTAKVFDVLNKAK